MASRWRARRGHSAQSGWNTSGAKRRSSCRAATAGWRASVVGAQPAADQHRDLHRLLVVEPRVDGGLVSAGEIRLFQAAGAAHALRDVVAGELEVHAAEPAALLLMNAERGA